MRTPVLILPVKAKLCGRGGGGKNGKILRTSFTDGPKVSLSVFHLIYVVYHLSKNKSAFGGRALRARIVVYNVYQVFHHHASVQPPSFF